MVDIHIATSSLTDNSAGQVCMEMPKGLYVLLEFRLKQEKSVSEVGTLWKNSQYDTLPTQYYWVREIEKILF